MDGADAGSSAAAEAQFAVRVTFPSKESALRALQAYSKQTGFQIKLFKNRKHCVVARCGRREDQFAHAAAPPVTTEVPVVPPGHDGDDVDEDGSSSSSHTDNGLDRTARSPTTHKGPLRIVYNADCNFRAVIYLRKQSGLWQVSALTPHTCLPTASSVCCIFFLPFFPPPLCCFFLSRFLCFAACVSARCCRAAACTYGIKHLKGNCGYGNNTWHRAQCSHGSALGLRPQRRKQSWRKGSTIPEDCVVFCCCSCC